MSARRPRNLRSPKNEKKLSLESAGHPQDVLDVLLLTIIEISLLLTVGLKSGCVRM